jgi:hypothetical protein
MDDLRQIRDRHDALPDPAPEIISEARARLTAHMRQPPSRKRSWYPVWGLGLAGAVGAALLVVAVVAVLGASENRPGERLPARLRPVANAQDVAHNAAITAAAKREPMPKPRNGRT